MTADRKALAVTDPIPSVARSSEPPAALVAPSNRSDAGGWSGHGFPEHGDFVRPRPSGNVHIAEIVTPYSSRGARVELACGVAWSTDVLDPSDGDRPRQCQRCWDNVGWSLVRSSTQGASRG